MNVRMITLGVDPDDSRVEWICIGSYEVIQYRTQTILVGGIVFIPHVPLA